MRGVFLHRLNNIPNKRTFYFPRFKNNGLIPSLGQNVRVNFYHVTNKYIDNLYIVSCVNIPLTHDTIGRTVFSVRRKFTKDYPKVVRAEGSNIYLDNNQIIFDASCGAAVNCLGHTNARVAKAMYDIQTAGLAYFSSAIFLTDHAELLAKELLAGTGNKMSVVYLTGSGSEAVEAMVKAVLQYHKSLDPNTKRVKFISRLPSYHGTTSGALALTQMGARKEVFTS